MSAPAGAQFLHALIVQRYPRFQARRRGYVGLGGALDGRGGSGPGGGERARDHVKDEAHPEAITAPLEAANGAAAEHAIGYGDGELDGGVREVAAGPRETRRP
jgi:hypothetical protein